MEEKRKVLHFKVNGETVLEERCNLYLNQIDELKWGIALELGCMPEDIVVEPVEVPIEMSEEIDVSSIGMIFWKDTYFEPIIGIVCDLAEGSDPYLDAIANGTIEKYLRFIK